MVRKKIDKETPIYVANNVFSSFSYDNGRGTAIELLEHGDDEVLTFSELKTLATGRSKATLQKMYLLITEVLSDEVELEDVIEQLRLSKVYDEAKEVLGVDQVDADSFTDFVIGSSDKELAEALKVDNLRPALVEAGVHLYSEREIQDSKLKIVLDSIGINDVYSFISDLESSK